MESLKTASDPRIPGEDAIAGFDPPRYSGRSYPCIPGSIPPVHLGSGEYLLRFAQDARDLDAVCELRSEVHNFEMGEGPHASFTTRRDADGFDSQCHHLMVIQRSTGKCVGSYRMQTGPMALLRGGFHSGVEFDLSGFPRPFFDHGVEVGPACIHGLHRNGRVLQLLWKGLARYIDWNGKWHLFGCCSLPSADPAIGIALYHRLRLLDYCHPDLFAKPHPDFACHAPELAVLDALQPPLPRLFEGYLNLGGRICGEPALNRPLKTMDFLVSLNIYDMAPGVFRKLLA